LGFSIAKIHNAIHLLSTHLVVDYLLPNIIFNLKWNHLPKRNRIMLFIFIHSCHARTQIYCIVILYFVCIFVGCFLYLFFYLYVLFRCFCTCKMLLFVVTQFFVPIVYYTPLWKIGYTEQGSLIKNQSINHIFQYSHLFVLLSTAEHKYTSMHHSNNYFTNHLL